MNAQCICHFQQQRRVDDEDDESATCDNNQSQNIMHINKGH